MTHQHINYVYCGVDLADMSPLEYNAACLGYDIFQHICDFLLDAVTTATQRSTRVDSYRPDPHHGIRN